MKIFDRLWPVLVLGSVLCLGSEEAGASEGEVHLRELGRTTASVASAADPPLPDPSTFPVQLVLDDDTAEGVFGITGGTARQFLWLNSFAGPGAFTLEEIWVLFPAGTEVEVGDEIQLAVYKDADGDPTNGAVLLATYDVTVQANNGNTFSVYPLESSLDISGGGAVLIGAVNRYYETGTDPPPTEPAAVDTTDGQGRSYFALWAGDPPEDPELAGALVIGALAGPSDGNFMIRGFGSALPVVDVPTLGAGGLLALIGVLALAGWILVLRSRRTTAARH